MNSDILERIRLREADIENHVDSVVQQMLLREEIQNDRHKLLIDHFIAQKVKSITAVADQLADMYLDEDEILEARNAPAEGREVIMNAFKEFEAKAADIRERRSTAARHLPPVQHELSTPHRQIVEELFSPSERYGRCLHLEESHRLFFNFCHQTIKISGGCLPGGEITEGHLKEEIQSWSASWNNCSDYLSYISGMTDQIIRDLPAHQKLVGFQQYKEWTNNLLEYLTNFYRRLRPLDEENLAQLMTDVETKAEEYWSALLQVKDILWVDNAPNATNAKKSGGLIVPSTTRKYLDQFSLWPLPFIQSVLQQCKDISHTMDETLRYFPRSVEEVQHTCFVEAKIVALLTTVLFDTYQGTSTMLKRNQSKTLEEIEQERYKEEEDFEESLKKMQKHTQNTVEETIAQAAQYHLQAMKETQAAAAEEEGTAVPEEEPEEGQLVGDDGKPIPRWLVQLQQLDKTFYCGVCGGKMYRGPKIFREHFGGETHAEGLRRLCVTENLKCYEGLTEVRDVIAMRDSLSKVLVGTRKRLLEEVEMEEIQEMTTGKVIKFRDFNRYQQQLSEKARRAAQ